MHKNKLVPKAYLKRKSTSRLSPEATDELPNLTYTAPGRHIQSHFQTDLLFKCRPTTKPRHHLRSISCHSFHPYVHIIAILFGGLCLPNAFPFKASFSLLSVHACHSNHTSQALHSQDIHYSSLKKSHTLSYYSIL